MALAPPHTYPADYTTLNQSMVGLLGHI